MDVVEARQLEATLSPDRFATYLAAAGSDHVRAMRLYGWNVEVSAAFWGPLQAVEIALRNAIHRQLSTHFSRQEWWDEPTATLTPRHVAAITDAKCTLARQNKPLAPGAVVAELGFAFWLGMIGPGASYDMLYWRPALHRAFPHYRGRRRDLHSQIDHLRLFRNRIAHHEPIFDRHLSADEASIDRVVGYICPTTQAWVARLSRLSVIIARQQDVLDGRRPNYF